MRTRPPAADPASRCAAGRRREARPSFPSFPSFPCSVGSVVSVRPAPLGLFASIAAAARAARSSTRLKTSPPLSNAASVPSSGSSNESSDAAGPASFEGPGFEPASGLLPPRSVRTRSLACASRTRRSRRDTAASNSILASSFFSSSFSSSSLRGCVLDRSAGGAGIRARFDPAFGAGFGDRAGDRSGDPRTSFRSPDASTHSAIVRAFRPPGLAAWNAAGSTACDHPPSPSSVVTVGTCVVGSTRAESPRRSVVRVPTRSSSGSTAILRKDSRSGMVTPSIPASLSTPARRRRLGAWGAAGRPTRPHPPRRRRRSFLFRRRNGRRDRSRGERRRA